MSSLTTKIDKIEINRAFRTSNKAKQIDTDYEYTGLDNGFSVDGTFYPYSSKSFNGADTFLYNTEGSGYPLPILSEGDTMTPCYAGTRMVAPSNTTSGGQYKRYSDVLTGKYQDITILGKEIMYGIPYTTYECYDNVSDPNTTIHKVNYLMMVHTMQNVEHQYYSFDEFSNIGVQWNLNFDKDFDYSTIDSFLYYPKKHIWLEDDYLPADSYDYIVDVEKSYLCFPNFQQISPYEYPYDITGRNIYTPRSYGLGTTDVRFCIPFYTDMPSSLSQYDFSGALTYSCDDLILTNTYYTDNLLIHDAKINNFNNAVSYYYTDMETQLVYHTDASGDWHNNIPLRFNFKLLPTKSAAHSRQRLFIWKGAPFEANVTGYPYAYDCGEFISSYQSFIDSGNIIYPASIKYGDKYKGRTFLPTIQINDISEMEVYDGHYYAPIDTSKCDEIFRILENICSTAVNEIVLVPASNCPDYSNYPSDIRLNKKDVKITIEETVHDPVDFFKEEWN